ncbi:MAG TPA: VacJ family lipoprotein [Thermohalobaculum sp.]|nr:VacJ family lipoprotein [Thermohalobaculum sp.]
MKLFKVAGTWGLALALLGSAACTAVDPGADFAELDQQEPLSREFHEFNVGWDTAFIRPAAKTYDKFTPATVQLLVSNGFSHLTLPRDFANYVFQGKPVRALETLGRFTLNTIMGAGGLLDPATEFGLPKRDTDFGVTMARHGASEGSYLVFPLFGPTTSRDTVGRVVDLAFAPTTYLGLTLAESGAEYGAELIEFRDREMDAIDDVLYESEDSYVTLRAVYLQSRRALIAGDGVEPDALPNIFEQN